jgi:hypothetical protein
MNRKMSGARSGLLKAIAGLNLAMAGAACGGSAFTTAGADASASPTVDAKVAEGAPSDAATAPPDAGAGWCATQAPTHTFCEDFLHGVPGKFIGITAGNGMLMPDPKDYESLPQSMAAITPSLAKKDDSATALGTRDFTTVAGTQFALAAYFKIAKSCFPANGAVDPVSPIVLQFAEQDYGIAIDVIPSGVELVEVTVGADGGQVAGSPKVSRLYAAANLFDSWQLWTLTIDGALVGKSATLSIGNAIVISRMPLSPPISASTALLQHPTLFLGATVKNDQALSPGCKVNVDDVLFDVKTN